MKRETFNKGFAALVTAYTISSKLSDESQDVYWEMLQGLDDAVFDRGVKACLADCKFFPTIAELGEACLPVNGLGYNWRQQIERKQDRKALTQRATRFINE